MGFKRCWDTGSIVVLTLLLTGVLGTFGSGCQTEEKKVLGGPIAVVSDEKPPAQPKPAPKPVAEEATPEAAEGMVSVAAGKFWRGCKEELDPGCEEPEKPGREIFLDMFQVDRTEVTVARYAQCVKAGGCKTDGLEIPVFKGKEQKDWAWACNWGKPGRENHPINCVSYEQADAFCKWDKKRLPTEAEWEKAARGQDGRKYSWGNEEYAALAKVGKKVANVADESEKMRDPAWKVTSGYDDGFAGTAPVGSFPDGASPCGALDMTGNVLEWVSDWHDDDYYRKAPEKNPKGPDTGTLHLARGGAWYGEPSTTRLGLRWVNPVRRIVAVGVRCARTP